MKGRMTMREFDMHGAKCDDIRPILKEIEDNFDIAFDYTTGRYRITHNGKLFQTVPYGGVTRKLIAEIRHTVWLNRTGQMIDYVDRKNEKAEASEDRRLSDYSEALAKDLRRPLINNYLYGM